jgi:hypothetical protein
MYAHFFKHRGSGFDLFITRSPDLRGIYDEKDTGGNFVAKLWVPGKREARAYAKEYNAVCWNF